MLRKVFQAMAVLFMAVSAILLLSPNQSAEAASEGSPNNTGIISSTTYANVYKGPGKSYGLTGERVYEGEMVKTEKTKSGWTYVQSNDIFGWVWGEYVEPSSGIGVITNTTYANLYNGAGKKFGTKGKVNAGTKVVTFQTKSGWTHVYVNGEEGWVWGEYVQTYTGLGNITSTTYANLYNGAGKKYGTNGKLDKGATLLYGSLKNGWRQVYADGQSGWVWDEFVKQASSNSIYEGVVTNPTYVNLYNSAGKAYGTKGKMNNGQDVLVFGTLSGWKYVLANGEEGWVWGNYITDTVNSAVIANTTYANLYNDAKKASGTKGKISADTVVEAYESKNGWRRVKSGDSEGWVWGEYAELKLKFVSGAEGTKKLKDSAKVYRGPDTDTGTIGTIPINAEVSYYNLSNGWIYVHSGNLMGWISDGYIYSYLYLDLRKPANITAKVINDYIEQGAAAYGKKSVLAGKGQSLIDAANKYGINALYFAAHAIHESAYGTSNLAYGKYNLFGLSAFDGAPFDCAARFKSVEEMIDYEAGYVRFNYLEQTGTKYNGPYLGNKEGGMNVKYASDPLWGQKIANHMEKMKAFDSEYYSKVKPVTSVSYSMPSLPNYSDYYPANIKTEALKTLPLYSQKIYSNNYKVATIPAGKQFYILEKTNDFWVRVNYSGKEYWTKFAFSSYRDYIQVYNLLRAETKDNSSVTIYKDANTSSTSIEKVKNNSYLEGILDKDNKLTTDKSEAWYKVKTTSGNTGWVKKSSVKRVYYTEPKK